MSDEELHSLSLDMAAAVMPILVHVRGELAVVIYSFYKALSEANELSLVQSEEVRGAVKSVALNGFIQTISQKQFADGIDELIDIVNAQRTLNEANKLLNNE